MFTYQQFINETRPRSLQRECEDSFIAYCKKNNIVGDTDLIARMTLNIGFDLLRQKYILDALEYKIGLFALELAITKVITDYYNRR